MKSFEILRQYIIPQHLLSRCFDHIAHIESPWAKNKLIDWFIKRYQVNMSEALETNPHAYQHFNAFFTRQLQPTVRPIDNDENTIVSPVDGTISQIGTINQGRIIQAKGFDFTVDELLGGQAGAPLFHYGQFATLYLAPKDYHRIHMPCAGELQHMTYIPGSLFSVNDHTAANVPRLFARNERVVCFFQTDFGPMALILVGAIIVASIYTSWAGKIAPQRSRQVQSWQYPNAFAFKKGADVGHFELGSTVIVLFANERIQWQPQLKTGNSIKMGCVIARHNNKI